VVQLHIDARNKMGPCFGIGCRDQVAGNFDYEWNSGMQAVNKKLAAHLSLDTKVRGKVASSLLEAVETVSLRR